MCTRSHKLLPSIPSVALLALLVGAACASDPEVQATRAKGCKVPQAQAIPGGTLRPAEGEHELQGGWIGAGQPSEARLQEVVERGARVITLRGTSEEPFDEQAAVEGWGGTLLRHATSAKDFGDEAFREALFDLFDRQRAEPGVVYLHCASANRVGASWALYQGLRRGMPAEEALALGEAAGLGSLGPSVRELLGLQ